MFQLFFYLFNKLDEINHEGEGVILPFYQKSVEITHKINNKIAFFFFILITRKKKSVNILKKIEEYLCNNQKIINEGIKNV